jgi:endoglycosylceramidase
MRRIVSVVVAGLLLAALSPVRAPAADPRFYADSPFIRDEVGRVRFFHGVNAVWKHGTYYPPATHFDETDAQFLADNGLNSVRLGVIWKGAEPARDVFDEAYFDHIEQIVDTLGAYGVTVLLDFHQDMYNERFDGEGFPDWATHTEALADQQAGDQTIPAAALTTVPETNCCGFPGNYFTPATMRAFDNLWTNSFGLWAEFRDFWRHVAARFAGKANVIGYDLLNEPWPGSQWSSCANPAGCPGFDAAFLQRFYEQAITGIRAADPAGMVWWEPNVTNDFGAANGVGLVTPLYDPGANTGISFHDYCLVGGLAPGVSRADDPECPTAEDLTMRRQHEAAERNGAALFLTEFGASDDLVDIARVADLADRSMVSWHYWHYGSWSDPTGNPQAEGMFADDLNRPGSLKQAKADVLIRPYPQAVAGTPVSFRFDPATKEFTLTYVVDPAISAPTEIFVPVARHYGGTYAVTVAGPALVTSGTNATTLTLANTGPGTVTVTVTAG